MVLTKILDEFLTVIACHTLSEALYAQSALRGLWETTADRGRRGLAAWVAAQRAGLLATIDTQFVVLRASESMLGVGLRLEPEVVDRPAKGVPLSIARAPKLTVVTIPPTEGPVRRMDGVEGERARVNEWVTSALNFLPPIGLIVVWPTATMDEGR